MVKDTKYVQIDTESFIKLCDDNAALKHEVSLLNQHIEDLQHSIYRLSGKNRQFQSEVNANRFHRESRFRHNLNRDITSFDSIVEENIKLKKEIAELKEKLSQ